MKICNSFFVNNLIRHLIIFITTLMMAQATLANPVLDNVAAGNVTVSQSPNYTQVNQTSDKAIINWQSFNIGANETTHFQQPTNGVALNRINPEMGASEIYGHLSATGTIILVNQAGVFFGSGAQVNVGGIIVSAHDISDSNFLAGNYIFDGTSPYHGSVINEGLIQAANYGLVALVGAGVSNAGTITAHMGNIVLASGNKVTVNFSDDQLVNFTVDEPTAALGVDPNGNELQSAVSNTGTLIADGGTITMMAQTAQNIVNQAIDMEGVAQAQSVSEHNGVIILDGTNGQVNVAGSLDVSGQQQSTQGGQVEILGNTISIASPTVINASGDAGGGEILIGGNSHGMGPEQNAYSTSVGAGVQINADAIHSGNGGKIVVWSDNDTSFDANVSARGGAAEGGNGGSLETSGQQLSIAGMTINLSAPDGQTGTWLIDPENVTIANNGGSNVNESFGSGTYTPSGDNAIVDTSDLQSALAASNVIITTGGTGSTGSQNGDITVANSFSWTSDNTLTLSAYRDITINSGVTISNNSTSGGLTLQANNSGAFSGTSGHGIVTQNGTLDINSTGNVNVYYNTPDYTSPVTYTNTGTAPLTAYMLVNNVNDLQAMSNNLSGNYALSTDIDASATRTWNSGAGFMPIGSTSTFLGNFDGQNHVIDGLYMNRTADGITIHNLGLFSDDNGNISNVGLTNIDIQYALNNANAGALVGFYSGTMTNSYSTGTIHGTGTASQVIVGGLVGTNFGGTISNSYSTVAVSGGGTDFSLTFDFGGLVGRSISGTFINSYSTGSVSVNAGSSGTINTGGFVGLDEGGSTYTNNFWDTETSGQSSDFGATGETTANMMTQATFSGAGWDFGSTWGIIEGTSYPYLQSFYSATPRVVSGTSNAPLGTVAIAANGVKVGTAYVGANGFFYDLFKSTTIADSSALLAYITAGDQSNAIAIAGSGGNSITGLTLNSNTITLGNSLSATLSNTLLGQAEGTLNQTDNSILYSVSGANLTLGNSSISNVALSTTAPTTYNIDGNISEFSGTITNYAFNGVTNILASSALTSTNDQVYNNAVNLSASAAFTSNAGNINFNGALSGSSQTLTLAAGGSGNHNFVFSTIPSLGSLIVNGNTTGNNTLDFSADTQSITLNLSAPTSGNQFNSGSIGVIAFNQIQQVIGPTTGTNTLVLPANKSNISVTYTNPAHTAGSISDPFVFSNFTVVFPPSPPVNTAPPPTRSDVVQVVTGSTTPPVESGPAIPTVVNQVVDQSINDIITDQVTVDDNTNKSVAVGCFQAQ